MPQEHMPERLYIPGLSFVEDEFLNVQNPRDTVYVKESVLSALAERVKELEDVGRRYMALTDPQLSCGDQQDDPAGGHCGTCRACYADKCDKLTERVERAEGLLKELSESTTCVNCSDRGFYSSWDGVHEPKQQECECSREPNSRYSILSRISSFLYDGTKVKP